MNGGRSATTVLCLCLCLACLRSSSEALAKGDACERS